MQTGQVGLTQELLMTLQWQCVCMLSKHNMLLTASPSWEGGTVRSAVKIMQCGTECDTNGHIAARYGTCRELTPFARGFIKAEAAPRGRNQEKAGS